MCFATSSYDIVDKVVNVYGTFHSNAATAGISSPNGFALVKYRFY